MYAMQVYIEKSRTFSSSQIGPVPSLQRPLSSLTIQMPSHALPQSILIHDSPRSPCQPTPALTDAAKRNAPPRCKLEREKKKEGEVRGNHRRLLKRLSTLSWRSADALSKPTLSASHALRPPAMKSSTPAQPSASNYLPLPQGQSAGPEALMSAGLWVWLVHSGGP